jgi:hypothetical protein
MKGHPKKKAKEERNLGEEIDHTLDKNSLTFFRLSEL